MDLRSSYDPHVSPPPSSPLAVSSSCRWQRGGATAPPGALAPIGARSNRGAAPVGGPTARLRSRRPHLHALVWASGARALPQREPAPLTAPRARGSARGTRARRQSEARRPSAPGCVRGLIGCSGAGSGHRASVGRAREATLETAPIAGGAGGSPPPAARPDGSVPRGRRRGTGSYPARASPRVRAGPCESTAAARAPTEHEALAGDSSRIQARPPPT
jgi:hypothetical protein